MQLPCMYRFAVTQKEKSRHGKCLNQVKRCAMMGERGGGTDEAWLRREESDGDVYVCVCVVVEGWRGGVVDCFSYKSGIADRSPYQTTGYSGLCVSVTGAEDSGRAFYNSIDLQGPVIFLSLYLIFSLNIFLLLFLLKSEFNLSRTFCVSMVSFSLRHTEEHQHNWNYIVWTDSWRSFFFQR